MPRSSSSLRSASDGSITTSCDSVEGEMALDQRQRAAADRAEADHHDGAVDAAVDGVVGHEQSLLAACAGTRNATG